MTESQDTIFRDSGHDGSSLQDDTKDAATLRKQEAVLREMNEAPVSIDEIDNFKFLTKTKEIEIAGGDLESHVRTYETVLPGRKRSAYYHDLIFALIQIRLPEEVAKKDWQEILRHKYTMSEKLGRNIGIHVATLDYYTNIRRYMRHPKIVDANEYVDTASHAISDELTQAYNRRFFDTELRRLFKYCDAFGRTFSLLMMDLDHFKMYNDVNGHIKGDIALIESVRIFHAISGLQARVCRYGGEEFTVLLPNVPLSDAAKTAESIRQAIYDYRYVNEQALPGNRLTISCGVAEFSRKFSDEKMMLDASDKALYRAKNNGRNRVEIFTPEA
jgi:diguanylate cyclase (GGDEF)-like protein